jgi:hypothetical protein
MGQPKHVEGVVTESAFLIAGLSAILLIWGFCHEAFNLVAQGVPLSFLLARGVQEYMVSGGMAAPREPAGADATVHMSAPLAGRVSRPG